MTDRPPPPPDPTPAGRGRARWLDWRELAGHAASSARSTARVVASLVPSLRGEGRTWVLHWLAFVGVATVLLVWVAGLVPAPCVPGLPCFDPRVVVEVSSDAVEMAPAAALDIVRLAEPRHGLNADLTPFEGLLLTEPLEAREVAARLRVPYPEGRPGPGGVRFETLRQLEIGAGCIVRVEALPRRWVRIAVVNPTAASERRAPGGEGGGDGGAACTVTAEFQTRVDDPDDLPDFVLLGPDTVHPNQPANLQFAVAAAQWPLRLRRIPVTGLGFTRAGESGLESVVRSGVLSLPDQGIEGERIYMADVVGLGRLSGEVVELTVGDSVATVYRGTASHPTLSERELRPSILRWIVHSDSWMLPLLALTSVVGLLAGVFQATDRP